jgi:hypothetical protein
MVPEVGVLAATARTLLSRGGTVESDGGSGPIEDGSLRVAVGDTLRSIVSPESSETTDATSEKAIRLAAAAAVARVRTALARVENGEPPKALDEEDRSALELIVRTVGRPALRYRGERVEMPANALGDNSRWHVVLATERNKIGELSKRVGRIAHDNGCDPVLGTGWTIGPELLITNRHVARRLVAAPELPVSEWRLDRAKVAFVDFAHTDGSAGSARCELDELAYCAEDRWVDLAVFRIKPGNAPVPPRLPIDWDIRLLGRERAGGNGEVEFQGGEIYIVGHPYQINATTHASGVFGDADGRKRFSPGLVTTVRDDKPIFLHDCSTLGGHSGSCVISLEVAGHAVVGLHFGGREDPAERDTGLGIANFALSFGRIKAQKHRAADILQSGKI